VILTICVILPKSNLPCLNKNDHQFTKWRILYRQDDCILEDIDYNPMKIITVVGARPQFIKAAVVSRAIQSYNRHAGSEVIVEKILHTGQHYDTQMSDVFFREMDIPEPAFRFEFNRLSHGAMTGRMLEQIETVLLTEEPDAVLVYGDTNSTLAGALAAAKCHIPVIHVEAGLRSYNNRMPEEINRILTDRISSLLCCPTDQAVENLRLEGSDFLKMDIVLTGDVMYDAALYYSKKSEAEAIEAKKLMSESETYILATVHRAENTDDPGRLMQIINALNTQNRHTKVVLPLHPRTRQKIDTLELNLECTLCEPLGYFDMLALIKNSSLIVTDSGGLQKESYFFKKPCVTLRDETEWTELTSGGYNMLAGADSSSILNAVKTMQQATPDWTTSLYGDGNAGDLIVTQIVRYFAV